ncbi:uncharacterized protein LOC114712639 [Neltuma alba]|uniref:uncharacterized protein LOC114712639 n=1 Tax=Neltuma alba TaxID=207710 RepID=UPI0010A30404|nr:uncharacterized protein LOC114712639 [Prosopis alba]
MDHRKEFVCVFANGRIFNGPAGVTFESDNVKIIKVDENITLGKLKQVIGRKLRLPPYQNVTNLVYRYPTCINPPQYQACNLEDDTDIKQMWQVTRRFSTQLTCAELYANICDLPDNHHIESQPIGDYVENMPPSSSNRVNMMEQESMFSDDMESFQPFELPIDGGNIISSCSLPHVEDIMDESEDEEEYDSYLNAGNGDDNGDNDNEYDEMNEQNQVTNASLSQIHVESVTTPEFGELEDILHVSDNEELNVGKIFSNVQVLRRAVKLYSVRVHHTFKVYYSCKKYEEYRCVNYGDNCNWRVRACKKESKNYWQITKYGGPHVCLSTSLTQDHPKLDADVISSCIVAMVTDKPDVKVSQIIERMQSMFGYTVSYRKAWKAKQLAIAIAFGNWETSYSLLPRWLAVVQHFMPGSCIYFSNKQCSQVNTNGQLIEMFHRVFWTFKPCIDAFLYLKPIIQVDGTFLYGKYKGTLLMAISQDGDRNVVPLAFAIVEGETRSAWAWFLHLVRQCVVKDRTGICLISDRHRSILAAVAQPQVGWQPPHGHHVFCLRHVASNLHKAHGTNWLKEKFINIGYAYERHVVDRELAEIALHHTPAARWIGAIPKEKWSRAYDLEGLRFGHMTTNLAECMNNVFKGVRSLPITGLVKATMYRVNNYFVKRAQQVHAQIMVGKVFSETMTKKLDIATQSASACVVRDFNRIATSFEVMEPYNVRCRQFRRCCKVNLIDRKCDCGEFQAEKFPCMHAIAACARVGIDHLQYVDPVFRLETMQMVYNNEFQPVGDEMYWPQIDCPLLIPNPSMIRDKGRPRSSRIRNEMDWTTPNEPNKCGLCRQVGHNRSTCPQSVASRQ